VKRKTYTITLTQNELDLLESILSDVEDDYTDPDDDSTVGDESVTDVYKSLQNKLSV
jgi:hypothetical protein